MTLPSTAALTVRPSSEVAQRLIDATAEIIDRDGEAAVRVQDVIAAVGVPVPVLYRHFGNREGLVQAAQVDRLMDELDAELARITGYVESVSSAEEFRVLIDEVLAGISTPERRASRWRRVNILGSTYGRPALTAAVVQLQSRAVHAIAELLRPPQEKGWLRAGLDLDAFATWLAGYLIGRIVFELGDLGVDQAAYDELGAQAVRHLLFG